MHATIIERVLGMLPDDARLHTPYGATESLPVASIDSDTLLETRALTNQGVVCVGRPVPEAEVRVIRITDAPMPVGATTWSSPRARADRRRAPWSPTPT